MASTSRVSKGKGLTMLQETIQEGLRDDEDTPTNPDGIPQKVYLMDTVLYGIAKRGDINGFDNFASDIEFDIRVGKLGVQTRNILHIASENENGNFIAHVVAKYPQLSTFRDMGNNLPLHIAASKGSRNAVEALIERVVPPQLHEMLTAINEDLNTPLHAALVNGHSRVSEILVEKSIGGVRYQPNRLGKTPRYVAAEKGFSLLVRSYTEKIEDSDGNGLHAIFAAISSRNAGILEWILDKCEIAIPLFDEKGRTPLSAASSEGFYQGVRLILDSKYAVDALSWSDKSGSFPIHEAARKGYLDIVSEYLTRYPDTINMRDGNGQTFLHVAAAKGREPIVKHVLRMSGSEDVINKIDKKKESILHTATQNWRPVIVRMLTRDRRIRMDLHNSEGKTAIDVAEWNMDRTRPPNLAKCLTWDALNLAKAPRVKGAQRPKPFRIPYERQVVLYNVLLALVVLVVGSANTAIYAIPGGFVLSLIGSLLLVFCFMSDAAVRDAFGRLSSKFLTAALISLLVGLMNGLTSYLAGLGPVQWSIRASCMLCIFAVLLTHLVLFYPDATGDGIITRSLGNLALELQLMFYKFHKKHMKKYFKVRYN